MSRFFVRVRPRFPRDAAAAVVGAFLALSAPAPASALAAPAAADSTMRTAPSDIVGTVTDSASGQPVSSAEISVTQGAAIVANASSDEFGRFTVHNLQPGDYAVAVHFIGYRPLTARVTVTGSGAPVRLAFRLAAAVISLQAVEVRSQVPVAVNTRTGDQTFQQNDYHGAPTQTTSQILQQSIVGAVRAPTGEVHIRGQHAEYTYYVDGVPVPPGISGSLNELFDPEVVNNIDFQTGGWDAEYGGRNAAIINVQTKIPTGGFHAGASAYTGSFNSQGGAANVSTNNGRLGAFLSGAYQSTDMRQDPVMGNPTTDAPYNFHNAGTDGFAFGKVEYRGSSRDVMDLDLNWSRTHFAVPYDTAGGTSLNDHQTDVNGFVNLGWHHLFAAPDSGAGPDAAAPAELFTGLYYRAGSLQYVPGVTDAPSFVFFPDTTTRYNLRENRNFTTTGVKMDLTLHPRREVMLKTGILAQFTSGHENFEAFDLNGNPGPVSNSGLTGHDVGGYVEGAYSPVEQFQIRTGVRYDTHAAPFASLQTQWSPRIRFNFYPDAATTIYVYYGRLFMPTNIEDLRSITSVAQGGVATAPTLPERDDFYEAGLIRRLPVAGLTAKFSAYHKYSSPGIDDNTVPGSAITTDVNIAHIWITGLEGVLDFRPTGPLSGYVNVALNHAYGKGPITGGFFPTANPTGSFDLDHDQRLSIVGSATYSANKFYASATEIFGSGLTNGVDPSTCGCNYGTALFAFNPAIKVAPNAITNVSLGYAFIQGRTIIRPELYVTNLFDRRYVLKGAFFSGASYGRPRSVQFRVNVGM
jgi:Carboxypeptidase regulatory-like domain